MVFEVLVTWDPVSSNLLSPSAKSLDSPLSLKLHTLSLSFSPDFREAMALNSGRIRSNAAPDRVSRHPFRGALSRFRYFAGFLTIAISLFLTLSFLFTASSSPADLKFVSVSIVVFFLFFLIMIPSGFYFVVSRHGSFVEI